MIMKDTESIDDFCIKLHGLVTSIRALGEEIAESYVVKKLLRAGEVNCYSLRRNGLRK